MYVVTSLLPTQFMAARVTFIAILYFPSRVAMLDVLVYTTCVELEELVYTTYSTSSTASQDTTIEKVSVCKSPELIFTLCGGNGVAVICTCKAMQDIDKNILA